MAVNAEGTSEPLEAEQTIVAKNEFGKYSFPLWFTFCGLKEALEIK